MRRVNPVGCHFGDGLSRWCWGQQAAVEDLLDAIASAGYAFVRTWTCLYGSYWAGREIGPTFTAAYWDHVEAFTTALQLRGLRWLVSQGDLLRAYPSQDQRTAYMRHLAEVLSRYQPVAIGVDAANEALWNGEDDPARMGEVVAAFRSVLPLPVWSRTSGRTEEAEDLNVVDGSVFDVHGSRDGHSWDKLRHIFSIPRHGGLDCRLGIQSEPFGPGSRVSASENKHELNADVMQLAAIQSLMCRQAWVYFSGPGVISDEGEDLRTMPGFAETPAAAALLPRDVMSWPTLTHGGAADRVFAVPAGDDGTRVDQALSPDGRIVAVFYGPRWGECQPVQSVQIERSRLLGSAGKVIVGRVL